MKKWIIVSIFLIMLDQVSKYFVELYLYGEQVFIIRDFLALSYVENTGGAWGILNQYPIIFIIGVPLVLMTILFLIRKDNNITESAAWTMVIGGALGNYIDRVFRGYVVDFIDFLIWPVFNVADIFIVAGCGLLIVSMFIKKK